MIQSRLIRLKDAPTYLGMDKNRFSKDVRPYIPNLPIGRRGIAFDRHDLDRWVDDFKHKQVSKSPKSAENASSTACRQSRQSLKDHKNYAHMRKQLKDSLL